ncbi:MAG TPA: hypothetical protein DDW30_09155 [Clostridiales bacterium]|nr:hypothetical protein [Clostridiales bacterium]
MSSIFRREFRGLFAGPAGWTVLIALVLGAGILTTVNNFLSLSSDATRMFPILCDVLILLCPLLAAHSVTYDRAKHNTAWLRSLPLSRGAIVCGKYFAALSLFGIAAVYFAIFPLLIGIWGKVSYGSAYVSLLGWFLIAAAALAVSFLIASRTERRWLAVLLGAVACAVLYFLPLLAALIAAFPWVGILFFALVTAGAVLPSVLHDVRAGKVPVRGIAVFAPICAAAVLLFFVAKRFYTAILPAVLDYLSVFSRLDGFRDGHFDLTAVIFLLSVPVVCLALTVVLPDPQRKKGGAAHA